MDAKLISIKILQFLAACYHYTHLAYAMELIYGKTPLTGKGQGTPSNIDIGLGQQSKVFKVGIGVYLYVLMNSLKADASSLYALIVWDLPSGHSMDTFTMLTSASDA